MKVFIFLLLMFGGLSGYAKTPDENRKLQALFRSLGAAAVSGDAEAKRLGEEANRLREEAKRLNAQSSRYESKIKRVGPEMRKTTAQMNRGDIGWETDAIKMNEEIKKLKAESARLDRNKIKHLSALSKFREDLLLWSLKERRQSSYVTQPQGI